RSPGRVDQVGGVPARSALDAPLPCPAASRWGRRRPAANHGRRRGCTVCSRPFPIRMYHGQKATSVDIPELGSLPRAFHPPERRGGIGVTVAYGPLRDARRDHLAGLVLERVP